MPNPILAVRAAYAFVTLVRDPERLDVVFELIDSVFEQPQAQRELEVLLANPDIAAAARDRLRAPELDLGKLRALPEGSVGRVACAFFDKHGLDPAALPRRPAATDAEWMAAHLYETHDLWHVLTGFGPDVAGELGLQAFYSAQVDGPVALAILTAGLLNTLIYAPEERQQRLAAVARGWTMGRRAKLLPGLDWEAILARPLAEVRPELAIDVEPSHDAMAPLMAAASSRLAA